MSVARTPRSHPVADLYPQQRRVISTPADVYGSVVVRGSKSGWAGIEFGSTQNRATLMAAVNQDLMGFYWGTLLEWGAYWQRVSSTSLDYYARGTLVANYSTNYHILFGPNLTNRCNLYIGSGGDPSLYLDSVNPIYIRDTSSNVRWTLSTAATPALSANGVQLLTTRRTGWAAATGTATRTAFATGSVTLPQLAARVKALLDDLLTHGLIGA